MRLPSVLYHPIGSHAFTRGTAILLLVGVLALGHGWSWLRAHFWLIPPAAVQTLHTHVATTYCGGVACYRVDAATLRPYGTHGWCIRLDLYPLAHQDDALPANYVLLPHTTGWDVQPVPASVCDV